MSLTLGNVTTGTAHFSGITYSGTGILDLSAATSGNTYVGPATGGLVVTSGTVRATNPFCLRGGQRQSRCS